MALGPSDHALQSIQSPAMGADYTVASKIQTPIWSEDLNQYVERLPDRTDHEAFAALLRMSADERAAYAIGMIQREQTKRQRERAAFRRGQSDSVTNLRIAWDDLEDSWHRRHRVRVGAAATNIQRCETSILLAC